MAYSKQNFQNGQILNAANLEAMENGIIAGQGAHNLLDNSNFSDPVNTRGKNTYSDGGNEYTIDRWKTQYNTNMSIENGYINIFGQWELYQHIQNPKDGIYTFAARIRINSIGKHTPVIYVNDNSDSSNELSLDANIGEWKTYILQHDLSSTTGETITFALSPRGGDTTASISVEWAAMYKGAYTLDTLPPYVPKGKHVEMLNCNVPLAPHNLLDNSDFTNPVNQRGATTATLGKYFIDRWNTEPFPSGPSITIDGNGLTLLPTTGSTAGIFQEIPDYEKRKGKIHTFAICVGNEWKCVSFTMGNFGVGYQIHGLYFFSTDSRNILIRNNASDNPSPITIQRVALYEGSYTADTLPAYVPKGKHVEMLNCNVPLTPHNLLDNSDFRNSVNQRGIASGAVITGWDYFIDRWKARAENCSVSFSEEGITVSTPIGQTLPKETVKNGMTVTAAAKWSDGTICVASGVIRRTNEWGSFSSANINGHSLYVSDEGNGNNACMTISEGTVVWAALYEGSYDASTLPAYQPKGYTAELAECQRYYRPMPYPVIPCGNNPAGTQVYGFLPFIMRIDNPTVSCDTLYFFKGDSTFVPVSSASASTYKAGTRIVFNLSSNVEGNLAGTIAGNGITLNADL